MRWIGACWCSRDTSAVADARIHIAADGAADTIPNFCADLPNKRRWRRVWKL